MARDGRFEFVGAEGASAGGRMRAELKKWLLRAGINGKTGDEIVSSVTEAFINAVEHPVGRASGEVAVEGQISGSEVVFRVRDQGRWNETVDRTRNHYGYRLMKAQMDSVDVERGRSGTLVTLRRTI